MSRILGSLRCCKWTLKALTRNWPPGRTMRWLSPRKRLRNPAPVAVCAAAECSERAQRRSAQIRGAPFGERGRSRPIEPLEGSSESKSPRLVVQEACESADDTRSSRPHYIRPGLCSIVDRERTKGDARAVEDPIAAIFDLAESVDRQTPKIRKMLRYVRWFVSVWLLLDFFLILLSAAAFGGSPGLALLLFVPIVILLLAVRSVSGSTGRLVLLIFVLIFGGLQVLTTGGLVFLGAVLVALFILGFSILELMRDLRSFFDYFALRHRVIQRVRQADPVVYVPDGKDAVQRILSYLGAAGFAVFVKGFERAPTLADLQALKPAIEDVAGATKIPPARILVLWRSKADESVTPDVYEFLTKESARVKIRGSTFVCSLELAIERDDGTYDFIPVVVEPVMSGTGTPTAA